MKRILFFALTVIVAMACKPCKPDYTLIPAAAFDTVIDGKKIALFTLENGHGMAVQVTNYGARMVALWVPAKSESKDVIWGYSSIAGYVHSTDLFSGPIVGRYGNRIAKGRFSLNDKAYQTTINNGENHLHGGTNGWWSKIWDARMGKDEEGNQAVIMNYRSADGEEGYPGNVDIQVTYALLKDNSLKISYKANTDAPTVINATSHAYYNLHGTSAKSTNSHILKINAEYYTPTDEGLIPTGEIATVEGTPLDFRKPTAIGDRIETDFLPLKYGKGYDHNWVLSGSTVGIRTAAVVYEPSTHIEMTVLTDQPAMQFYSGNFMDGKDHGKRGDVHNFRTGIALETQNYPDAPNHANFPSAVLLPQDTYKHVCIYKFAVRK